MFRGDIRGGVDNVLAELVVREGAAQQGRIVELDVRDEETTASEPLPVVVEVMVIEPSLAVRLWPLTFTPVSSLGLAVAEPEALAFACAAAAS